MMWNIVMVAGPALGATVFTRWGLATALALDSTSFLVSAAQVSRLHVSSIESVSHTSSAWSGVREGWEYLDSAPATGRIAMLWFLSTLAIGVWVPLAPFFMRDALHGPDAAVGYQIAAIGCGGTLGRTNRRVGLPPVPPRSSADKRHADGGLSHGFSSREPPTMPCRSRSRRSCCREGFFVGIIFVTAQSMLQAWTPARLLGRVLSTVKQAENTASIGAMAAAVALSALCAPASDFSNRRDLLYSGDFAGGRHRQWQGFDIGAAHLGRSAEH